MWITIAPGQSAESVAYEHGHFVNTVWNAPESAPLKELRIDPHALAPGDRLYVPPRRTKQRNAATGMRHRFRYLGVPSRVIVTPHVGNESFPNAPYRLETKSRTRSGTTGPSGEVEVWIAPNEAGDDARLIVETLGGELVLPVALRHLQPITETAGIQARLRNLGLYHGELHGTLDAATVHAIALFQHRAGIEPTGLADDPTRAALLRFHGG
jgi:hypothetical protein